MKMIKFLKKIKPIYIILVLFVIVLIVSALGSKTKEGMTSGDYTTLRSYTTQRDDILSDINNFIIAQGNSSPWGSTDNFKTNLQSYIKTYTSFSIKQFFKSKDANADGAVVVRKSDGTFIRDNSGNILESDEKLFYYDLVAQDQNSDSTIVAFKDTDQGNFYKDNQDNSGSLTTSQSLSGTPHILQSIDRNDTVTQTKVDQAKSLLDNQINLLNTADKNTINTSISSLIDVIDKIVALTNSTGGGGTNADLYAYNPNYIETTSSDQYQQYQYLKNLQNQIVKLREDQYKKNSNNYDSKTADYWKNLYLNSLNTKSNQQTPLYGSLLNGNNGLYDAGDASSGTGMGYGPRIEGQITETSNYDISIPPVESRTNSRSGSSGATSAGGTSGASTTSAAGTGAGKTGDAYLLNNSQNSQPTNCPVGGCVTANSAPNNCRPAPVPPCPPCERCPEPKFDCKRVPSYNSSNNQYLPKPILSDFSQFGM